MTPLETEERAPVARAELRRRLLSDHRHIRDLAREVAARVDADDPYGALEVYADLERTLLAHMDAEEMHLFPRLADVDRDEANALRDQHGLIRAELGRIGLLLELHASRKSMFDALVAALDAHAKREESIAYTWAEESLPERAKHAILRRLHA
jgi:iron-sulfur cluster repair protein YtfE (RIC family)